MGESGTAKTVIIQKYFSLLDPGKFLILNMNFSSRTTSLDVQHSVEDSVEKRTKVISNPILHSHGFCGWWTRCMAKSVEVVLFESKVMTWSEHVSKVTNCKL